MHTTQQYVKFKCWWRLDFKIATLKVTFNLKYSLTVQESDPWGQIMVRLAHTLFPYVIICLHCGQVFSSAITNSLKDGSEHPLRSPLYIHDQHRKSIALCLYIVSNNQIFKLYKFSTS